MSNGVAAASHDANYTIAMSRYIFAVQIAESYRIGSKVRKWIVRHIGTAAPGTELEQMRREAAGEKERIRSAHSGNIILDATLADMAVCDGTLSVDSKVKA